MLWLVRSELCLLLGGKRVLRGILWLVCLVVSGSEK